MEIRSARRPSVPCSAVEATHHSSASAQHSTGSGSGARRLCTRDLNTEKAYN